MAAGDGHGDGHDHHAAGAGGTTSMQDGYMLMVSPVAGSDGKFTFHVMDMDASGALVTEFDDEMGKKMHLLAVRHDLTEYRHVHPTMDKTGNWSLDLSDVADGTYRLVADFKPTGADQMALGTDVAVGKAKTPKPDLQESRVSEVDGYRAELIGDSAHEGSAPLKVRITKDGAPVTEVKPYLGTSAHFVAFADTDLSYVHMHPNGDINDAGELTFTAPPMDHAVWKAYVQVDVGGDLRTFQFAFRGE